MLWLSLYLPHLPLEAIARTLEDPAAPLVVHETRGTRRIVIARNRAAAQAGIRPGTALATAQAMIDGLKLHMRAPAAETAALEGLAQWAGQYTSWLSLVETDGLNLEIAGSLRLFGGLETIQGHVRDGLTALGYRSRLAVAPTAQAAWLFARNGLPLVLTDRERLSEKLDEMPVASLRQPEIESTLRAMGLKRLGDCRRLPRSGLAQRLGPDFVATLDRLYGLRQEPPARFLAAECYRGQILLPALLDQVDALQFPLRRLLQEMEGFLRGRGLGAMRLLLELQPEAGEPARVTLGLAEPNRSPQHLLTLFRERLAREPLPGPVERLVLQTTETAPLEEHSRPLFREDAAPDGHIGALLEQLYARLGEAAVHGIGECADHRPERAWQYAPPGGATAFAYTPERPLWLLPQPRRLGERQGRPALDGELQILDGPERIQGGWWDGHAVLRDYFVAVSAAQALLWIFRDPGPPPAWYLHGFFA
jgi:protein ImuB